MSNISRSVEQLILNKDDSLEELVRAQRAGLIRPAQASLLTQLVSRGIAFAYQSDGGEAFMVMDAVEFLNHGVHTAGMNEWGRDLADQLQHLQPTKVITVKSGGIAIAHATATALGEVDYVYASKGTSLVLTEEESYVAANRSYTESRPIQLVIAKRSLLKGDRVILIDDFLDNGDTTLGVAELCRLSGAELVGAGYVIEKSGAGGRGKIRRGGHDFLIVNVVNVEQLIPGGMKIKGIDNCLFISEQAAVNGSNGNRGR